MKQDETITISRDRYNDMLNENLWCAERIAELEAALQPFADEAGAVEREFGPSPDHMITATIKYGDLRYAKQVLEINDGGDS